MTGKLLHLDARVSVIIPVWNGQTSIGRCLASLHRQSYPSDRIQIIVVDNGSTDKTIEVVQSFEDIILLTEPVESSYRARNLGLDHAKGDIIAFTDADCEVDPAWIEAGVSAITQNADTAVAAGSVQLIPAHENGYSRAAHLYEEQFAFRQDEAARLGHSMTVNWMSPRWVFEKVGKFDPELKSGGDLELSGRISGAGHCVRYVPDMVVYHPARSNIAELAAKRRRVTGGMWVREGKRQLFWLVLFLAIEAAKRSGKVLMATNYSLGDRLRLIGLLCRLAGIGAGELVRLAFFGGEPRRS